MFTFCVAWGHVLVSHCHSCQESTLNVGGVYSPQKNELCLRDMDRTSFVKKNFAMQIDSFPLCCVQQGMFVYLFILRGTRL